MNDVEVKAGSLPPRQRPFKKRVAYSTLREASDDPEARRLCAIILEVLGGGRTPTDAAGALKISVPRYYVLEARALRGLLEACQRRGKGRKRTAESELVHLGEELQRTRSERDRLGALLRASQRTLGIGPPPKPEKTGKKRKRRPQVRALRASKSLKEPAQNMLPASDKSAHDTVVVKG
jgi:hypothetical protein